MPPLAPEEPPSPEPITVETGSYRLSTALDRPYLELARPTGEPIARLFVPSSVHSAEGRDDTTTVSRWRKSDLGDQLVLELEATSSVWQRKIYRFRCWEERFSYEIEVEGNGRLTGVDYFGGYSSAHLRWGSGFFWSSGSFSRVFNPEPTVDETYHLAPDRSTAIDTTGVPSPGRGGWFFTPPPFCLGFEHEGGWLGIGVEATAGQNLFNELHYRAHRDGFHLSLPFESLPRVVGRHKLPALGFDFAAGDYEVLDRHVGSLRAQRLVPVPFDMPRPSWWNAPIFCGWGAQCYLASQKTGGHAPSESGEVNYRAFLAQLETNGLTPGTVVLDDKWQSSYGENRVDETKWPDLPGFISDQHEAGRKVLLWLKAWDPEGVPAEECIVNAAGIPVSVDPTNPAFERRFRESIRNMLSNEGYGADGFKLDFSARIASSPGLRIFDEGVWGLELMRRYLEILNDEAKATKPDALIMTHTPHPYLADLVDMIRLNDINVGHDVVRAMTHRARVARAACPEALIDTDNWPITDLESWRSYLELQPRLGVSSLYYATHIDSTGEALSEEDYELIRQTWGRKPAAAEVAGFGE